jgi:uncharacterized protein (TIGR02270 family)
MPAAAPVLWDMVEEHLDEASFLVARWEAALRSPLYTAEEVARGFEARLQAQLDGLVAAGPAAEERLLGPALESGEPERALAAALALLEGPGGSGLARVEGFLGAAPDPARAPVVRALGLARRAGLERELLRLAEKGAPAVAGAALEALAFRRVKAPDELLAVALAGTAAPAGALRAARLASPRLWPAVERAYRSADPAARDAALGSGLALGLRSAWLACQELVEARDPGAGFALEVLGLSGEPADEARIAGALEVEGLRPAALFALGLTGLPSAAEACLPLLADEKVGAVAAEAFSAVTGLAIEGSYARLPEERDELVPFEEEDLDADLSSRPEGELPLPDPPSIAAWWRGVRARFTPGTRWLAGRPFGAEALAATFLAGNMRRRQPLGLDLLVRSRREVEVETLGWAADQLRVQAARRLTARGEVGQPYGKLLRA